MTKFLVIKPRDILPILTAPSRSTEGIGFTADDESSLLHITYNRISLLMTYLKTRLGIESGRTMFVYDPNDDSFVHIPSEAESAKPFSRFTVPALIAGGMMGTSLMPALFPLLAVGIAAKNGWIKPLGGVAVPENIRIPRLSLPAEFTIKYRLSFEYESVKFSVYFHDFADESNLAQEKPDPGRQDRLEKIAEILAADADTKFEPCSRAMVELSQTVNAEIASRLQPAFNSHLKSLSLCKFDEKKAFIDESRETLSSLNLAVKCPVTKQPGVLSAIPPNEKNPNGQFLVRPRGFKAATISRANLADVLPVELMDSVPRREPLSEWHKKVLEEKRPKSR